MSEFKVSIILQASYKCDAMGWQAIRTLTSPSPDTIHSVFDSTSRRIAEFNQAIGAPICEYVWNGWETIAVIEGGQVYFVRADHIGRPVFATNNSGTQVWSAGGLPWDFSSVCDYGEDQFDPIPNVGPPWGVLLTDDWRKGHKCFDRNYTLTPLLGRTSQN